jgi:hypothetical protein
LFPVFTFAIENQKLTVNSELVSYSNCHSEQNNFMVNSPRYKTESFVPILLECHSWRLRMEDRRAPVLAAAATCCATMLFVD